MHYLHEIPPDEVQDYGGKAANLCLLQKYGFKVPRGFAISGRYYRQMIDTIPDAKELMKQLDMVDDFEEILELAANLQAKAMEMPIIVQETAGDKEYELEDMKKALAKAMAGEENEIVLWDK